MPSILFRVVCCLVLSLGIFAPLAVRAEGKGSFTTPKDVLDEVAGDIRKWMDDSGGLSEIAVGAIAQPPGITSGRGLGQLLIERLRLSNLIVKLGNAPYSVEGKVIKAQASGELIFQFIVVDENGAEKFRVPEKRLPLVQTIEDGDKVATGTNGGGLLAAGITAPGKATVAQLKKPESLVGIDGTQIFAKGAEPYRIEIVRKAGDKYDQRLTPEIKDGFAMVKMPGDSFFGVNLINQSNDDVAIILEIDGVNFFVMCDAKSEIKTKSGTVSVPKYTHYCLNKRDDVLITGWYKNEEKSFAFRATDDPELTKVAPGVVAKGDPARLGTITAQFYRAWDMPPKQPDDAILAARFRSKSVKGDPFVSVPGPEIDGPKSELRSVVWEEANRATISVRYEKE